MARETTRCELPGNIRLIEGDRVYLIDIDPHPHVEKKAGWCAHECLRIIEIGWRFTPYVHPVGKPKAGPNTENIYGTMQ